MLYVLLIDVLFSSRWKALDFAALKRSSVSFFDVHKQETAVSRWARARTRAAKVYSILIFQFFINETYSMFRSVYFCSESILTLRLILALESIVEEFPNTNSIKVERIVL